MNLHKAEDFFLVVLVTALLASSSSVECTSVDASVLGTASSAKLVQLEGSDAVAVIGSGGAALYSAAKAPKLIASLPGALAVSQPTQAESDSSSSSLGLDFVALGRGAQDYRVLVGGTEGTLALLEGSATTWKREEALSAIQGALFVDLPAPSAELEAQASAVAAPSITERLKAELLSAKEQLGFAQPEDRALLKELRAKSSDRLLPWQDAAGFRKQLLVLSTMGRLLALHSGDGRVLWSTAFDPTCLPTHLKLWRTSHDAVHAPEVIVLGNGQKGACYVTVDAHTGKAITGAALPFHISQVLEGPQTLMDGPTEQRILLLSSDDDSSDDSAPALHVLPDTAAARKLLGQSGQSLHHWAINTAAGSVSGYSVDAEARAELTWTAVFGSDKDAVLAAVTRPPGEPVYSHAKVLGDRSLKLKYLNPNLLLIATGPPNGAPAKGTKTPRLTISILDTVTGQVLFRQSHQDARGPVHAVLCENWAVYHFWSVAQHRHEMAVLELYDATPRTITVADVLFAEGNATQSAYQAPPLEALSQTFAIKAGVRGLAPVATQRGITAKLLLLATQSDQLYMMDKRFLDPRRPKGAPSKEDQAEMLLPYEAELPVSPLMFSSHQHSIARVSGIVTSPANLESTALVLAHGLDVFVTRVQPSKNFDLIPDDFPYALLITVTLVLAFAALVLRNLESSSGVSKKWT
ncbi:hypothetical protein WJX73_002264 [Symbiochloris irregularis]|uniref:ER membrane protein complex subunit 1 n=1 Tax=Symbiochloris irregularis TaxID=706552 RepID=A0AAW1P1Y4_9CHLO